MVIWGIMVMAILVWVTWTAGQGMLVIYPDPMVQDFIHKPQGAQYHASAHVELPSSLLQVPRADHHMIPLDPDAIVNHFGTPRKPKQGCSRADSVESRQSKVNCQSASHSSAGIQSTMVSTSAQSPSSAIPSTKVSTRPQSPNRNVSPVGSDFQGASHTTGGIFRGRALGNALNLADLKNRMDPDAFSKPNGKVLLYTS
jgi:hypothetical protein